MNKLTEKEIVKALKDHEFFRTLEPAQMLYVLVEELINKDGAREEDLEYWIEQEEQWEQVSLEDRIDQVVRVLSLDSPSETLKSMQNVGFMAFCLPYCFPLKGVWDKNTYYKIIDNFDKLSIRTDDDAFKLALLVYPMDPSKVLRNLVEANIDEESAAWIYDLMDNYMEFLRLNNEKKLRSFVARLGLDFYYDMNDYAQSVHKITGIHDLKPLESIKFIESAIKRGHILDYNDLAVTKDDLIRAGAESDEEVEALFSLILQHVAKDPSFNTKEYELDYIKKFTQNQIDKEIARLQKLGSRTYW